MPVTLEIVEGEAAITLGEEKVEGRPGTWIHLPANLSHRVVARTPVTMLLACSSVDADDLRLLCDGR